LIYDIQVERNLSRPEVAMHTLQRAVSLVKPLMRAHNFKVKLLAEFYPKERGLLGKPLSSEPHTTHTNISQASTLGRG
jgi:hypothetical protein